MKQKKSEDFFAFFKSKKYKKICKKRKKWKIL